ncbi:MAG: cache domain-containing protein [Aggregatilineales bacterium]|nr:cache domain-containing protein [Aggregatilineales bacterium]HPV08434.1 cache domain-containing protein [Aggregatilineales bacterium]HQE16961.1 cache domain-containing protein [Aggregatilineales bacterium]
MDSTLIPVPRKTGPWLSLESSYTRVIIAIVLIALGYLALVAYFVNSYTQRLYEVHEQEVKRVVDLGLAALDPLRQETSPTRSMEQYRREGAILIRDLTHRYRLGENYLFMGTTSGLMLVHPYEPELEFTNQWELKDANGKLIMQEMIAVATSDDRAGYVEYYDAPPNSNQPERKVTYVVGIPEWNAFIAAGMYMGEVDAQNAQYIRNSLILTLSLLALIFIVVFAALRPTLASYQTLRMLFEEVETNPESIPTVPVEKYREGSEAWYLMHSFERMLHQIERSKRAREEAVLNERHRIARELHDAVSQTLFSATLIADVLPRLYERSEEMGRKRLQELRELTRGAMAEMRTLLNELRPSALVQTELDELLRQLTEAVIARARIPVDLEIEGEFADIAPDVKIALYRIAQEALNNVFKHAHATQARVVLRREEGILSLCIADDGRGFDLEATAGERMGLNIMRERTDFINADLVIDTAPGEGTEVRVTWLHPDIR